MAISKHEFQKIIETMIAQKVPLSLPNLMVRTELPRHVIQEWLDDLHDEQIAKAKKEKPSLDAKLKNGVRQAREHLPKEMPKLPKYKRSWQLGLLFGFLFGPLGLFYAAPLALSASLSGFYVGALVAFHYLPFVGAAILTYIVPIVHIACAATNVYFVIARRVKKPIWWKWGVGED